MLELDYKNKIEKKIKIKAERSYLNYFNDLSRMVARYNSGRDDYSVVTRMCPASN